MHYFPDNTLTHYLTRLPQPIDLEGSWEIGLSEIQYPHSWYNVKEQEVFVQVHYPPKKKKGEDVKDIEIDLETAMFKAPEGYYHSPRRLVNWLEKAREKEHIDYFSLHISDIHHKAWINVKRGCHVVLSHTLMEILGFKRQFMFAEGTWKGDRPADISRGLNAIFVYCPLVEPRIVGDTQAPLMRIVPVEGKDHDDISHVFDPIQYVPLAQRRFQTIEIDLRDDTGKPVPFERGRVTVTLHCRKRAPSYLP